jgi:hypothetical protein
MAHIGILAVAPIFRQSSISIRLVSWALLLPRLTGISVSFGLNASFSGHPQSPREKERKNFLYSSAFCFNRLWVLQLASSFYHILAPSFHFNSTLKNALGSSI